MAQTYSTELSGQRSPTTEESNERNTSETTSSPNIMPSKQSSNTSTTNGDTMTKKESNKKKKKKKSRTPFQRPFWMNLSRRPFRNSGLRKPKSDSIMFPEESLLLKGIRKPYIYIFPDFQLNDAGPYKGVYWKQFYHPNE